MKNIRIELSHRETFKNGVYPCTTPPELGDTASYIWAFFGFRRLFSIVGNCYMNMVIEIPIWGGGQRKFMGVVSFLSIRSRSKVAEMEAMSSPDLRNIFSEKKSHRNIFFRSSKVKFPSIFHLNRLLFTKGISPKIEGNFTFELWKKYFDEIFFSKKYFLYPDCS